jgi:hypothetical protein
MSVVDMNKQMVCGDKDAFISKVKYHPTSINIFLLTNGDLTINEKTKFQYNMIGKDLRFTKSHFYILKNNKYDNYAIENAGYDADDNEIFTKDFKFDGVANYVDEKNKKPSNEQVEEIIRYNISYMLDRFFPYKGEIRLKNKEYIITKYKILHERGLVHIKEGSFFDIEYQNNQVVFIPKQIKELLREKRISCNERDNLEKENNVLNSINITIDLTLVDKGKNPSRLDFLNSNCSDKRENLRDTYSKLIFSLFGINLKKIGEEERLKRFHERFHYNYEKKKDKKTEEEELKKKIQERLYSKLFESDLKDKEKEKENDKEEKEKETDKEKEEKDNKKKLGGSKSEDSRRHVGRHRRSGRKITIKKKRSNTNKQHNTKTKRNKKDLH